MPSIANILTQNSNDKVEIKSQVDLDGQAFQSFKQFVEQFEVAEQATIVEQRNLSGGTAIYGNGSSALYGTARYNDSYINPLKIVRVISPNNNFQENFIGTVFIDSSSGGNLSGEGWAL